MSNSNNYDYLSLLEENDKKEPLINSNENIKHKDSTNLFNEENNNNNNNIFNIKTITTVNNEEEEERGINLRKQSSSSEEHSSVIEKENEKYKRQQNDAIRKLTWVSMICLIFMIIEVIGGYLANSIAIMSDAAHLLSDLLGFIISIISIYISKQLSKNLNNMSYGYHRAEIIGALVSIILIWTLTIWLLYEATMRIIHNPQVDGFIMIIVSIIGFSFNVIMGYVLTKSGVSHSHGLHNHDHDHGEHGQEHGHEHEHEHEHHNEHCDEIALHTESDTHQNTNVNLRASFIHILGDALQNIGVFIAGVIIYIFPNLSIADPICTYIFSIIVGFTTIRILNDCIFILMEGSPVAIDIEQLEEDLRNIPGVKQIHDLHVWSLSVGKVSMSCHICCDNPQKTLKKAEKKIKKKYKINVITIQVEENNNNNEICCKNDLH